MKTDCLFCQTLSRHVHAVDRRAIEESSRGTAFGRLPLDTTFSFFRCSECDTQWRWSIAKGWHYAGQRKRRPPMIAMRSARVEALPANVVSMAA